MGQSQGSGKSHGTCAGQKAKAQLLYTDNMIDYAAQWPSASAGTEIHTQFILTNRYEK